MKKQKLRKLETLQAKAQVLNATAQKTIKGGYVIIEDHVIM